MTPKIKLKINQGETFSYSMQWKDANDLPINLTGYYARMQVRKTVDDPIILLSLTTENARIIITPLTGTIVLKLTAAETSAITWISAVYDLELAIMVSGVENVTRLIEGSVSVSNQVTR